MSGAGEGGGPRRAVVLEGLATRAEQQAGPYLYLPFRVPEGAGRVEARLEHDPGNVIDLGVLDSRAGPFPARQGFRGWSGGARDRFFIARDDATPGYLPGPLPPGEWHVILGLYRILPEGCRYRVEIAVEPGDGPDLPGAAPHPSFPVADGWYPGDLQSHTFHSDAKGSLEDLVAAARQRGLRFLAVTDHNTVSHHRHLAAASSEELFLLPGEEVTTADGHANVWGARGWVDFRITRPEHVAAVVEEAHALGGLISVNHPKPGGPAWRYEVPTGIDCVEVWQSAWPAGNEESLAFTDRLLREGRRIVLVGGSDRHQPGWPDPDPPFLQVGSPTTWIRTDELSVSACLGALASGYVFISESPAGPFLELGVDGTPMGGVLRVEPGARLTATVGWAAAAEVELRLVGAGGSLVRERLPAGAAGTRDGAREKAFEIDSAAAGGYLRAELRHPGHERVLALSNPVFLEARAGA